MVLDVHEHGCVGNTWSLSLRSNRNFGTHDTNNQRLYSTTTMNSRIILLISLAGLMTLTMAQDYLAVPEVHAECRSTCVYGQNSTYSTCCGCCGSDSQCSGNTISKRCCPSTSNFCGCISNRAFCSGSVYNSTVYGNGTDSFGTCYDPSKAQCSYDPNPNLWIVCPLNYQVCQSSSFFSCCAPDSYCITSIGNSTYPICQPRDTSSPAASTIAEVPTTSAETPVSSTQTPSTSAQTPITSTQSTGNNAATSSVVLTSSSSENIASTSQDDSATAIANNQPATDSSATPATANRGQQSTGSAASLALSGATFFILLALF
ncbi:hypothetical protein PROFUN_15279 [Planoprotostelium fungivorum]|uniref:Uncharacterized protein n=1 Tax=Planoprotostelium fungivorum TaxID=1890364 RepID=A0A2P6MXG1_9EUKA|nr:hypothetical protein PROFUN_15279 [Planoprotostelium fungivorum]